MRIYTKTGDKGDTGMIGGSRVAKHSLPIVVVGDLDELNCHLGLCACLDLEGSTKALLIQVQSSVFDAGAEASAQGGLPGSYGALIGGLETDIDRISSELPEMKSFILPGGCQESARLHVARAVCRRAERSLVEMHQGSPFQSEILCFINRLSDWLFIAARWENHRRGLTDVPWTKTTPIT